MVRRPLTMTYWINQHLIETKELIQQWRMNRNVNVLVKPDHVEIASSHLVLGLHVGWENRTTTPIKVLEIQVMLYKPNELDPFAHLLPLERFERNDISRAFQKTPLSQFVLPPKTIHSENIRFITHQSMDIPSGMYTMDVQIRDISNHTYTRRTKIQIDSKIKYRLADDWTHTTEAP